MPDYKHDLPTNYYFGGFNDVTSAPPLTVVLVLTACILLLFLPRKYAFVPFIIAGLLISLGGVVVIGDLHFYSTRVLVMIGWLRLILRRERVAGRVQTIDKLVLSCAVSNAVVYCLLWQDFGAVINRLGFLVTTMGTYLLMRFLIRDRQDVARAIKALATVVIVIAPFMIYEYATDRNLFSALGSPAISDIRYGKVRAQGPFAHAIVAGTVGAVLFPLFVWLFRKGLRARLLASAAIVSSMVMVFASHSATPLLTLGAATVGLFLWPFRKGMRAIRWGVVMCMLALQLAMGAPIWFIMDRASGLLGGSGWHRSMLVDNFFRHFFQWWLVGTHDNPNWGWSMWDVDNAYVAAGLSGGLLSCILFIAVLVCAFKIIGKARRLAERNPRELRLIWVLGASLFANVVAFFGIVYWDQSIVAWYALLAMIAVVPTFVAAENRSQVQAQPALPEIGEEIPAFPSLSDQHQEVESVWR